MAEESKPIPLIDDPHAPDIFTTNVSGFVHLEGVISITMECAKSDYSGTSPELNRVVVGRLLMPTEAAHRLAVGLFDYLRTKGLIHDPPESKVQ